MESYYAEDSGGSDGESRRRVAEETKSLIMEEFAKRKKRVTDSDKKSMDAAAAVNSKCRAAENTSTKVNGLTVSGRESYLTLLLDALNTNLASMKDVDEPEQPLKRKDVEQCAIDLEYEAFSNSTVISLYRRAMTKLITSVKTSSESLYPRLKTFKPRMGETLSDFVRDFERKKEEKHQYGFVTASELESANTERKSDNRSLSKADKESKRKAHSFKRDPLTQTKLQNYFTPHCSNEASSSDIEQSEDESKLMIDETAKSNHNDTTLKLEEMNAANNINNNNTKHERKQLGNDNKHVQKTSTKTFVINITLQGVPSKEVQDKNEDNIKTGANKEIIKEAKTKLKPTAKRKIKALFGESSDSEQEPEKKDKLNIKDKHKDCKAPEKKKCKMNSVETSRSEKKQSEKKSAEVEDLFESGSENGLIIDEHVSDKEASAEKLLHAQETKYNENELLPQAKFGDQNFNTSMDEIPSVSRVDSDSRLRTDVENISSDSAFGEDTTLVKAHKLSEEADKVLMELKVFSEVQPETVPVNVAPDPVSNAICTEPTSPKLECKLKGKHNKKHKLNRNKEFKEKHVEKHEREHKDEKQHIDIDKSETIQAKESKKSEKVDVAGLVVKLLMPYYKKKKISSRDLFKITARHIVHQLLAIQVTEEAAINMLLKKTFTKEVKIETESDLPKQIDLSKVF